LKPELLFDASAIWAFSFLGCFMVLTDRILKSQLRIHRVRCGLNQSQLAGILGCHQSEISLTENGRRRPKAVTMRRIVAFLKIRPEVVRFFVGKSSAEK
jgi:transcriptional regulator with XRE-family HTH domain